MQVDEDGAKSEIQRKVPLVVFQFEKWDSSPDLVRRVLVIGLERSQGSIDSGQVEEHALGPTWRVANLKMVQHEELPTWPAISLWNNGCQPARGTNSMEFLNLSDGRNLDSTSGGAVDGSYQLKCKQSHNHTKQKWTTTMT